MTDSEFLQKIRITALLNRFYLKYQKPFIKMDFRLYLGSIRALNLWLRLEQIFYICIRQNQGAKKSLENMCVQSPVAALLSAFSGAGLGAL